MEFMFDLTANGLLVGLMYSLVAHLPRVGPHSGSPVLTRN